MTHGKSRGSADSLAFELSRDEQEVESLTLTGSAEAVFFKDAAVEGSAGQKIRAEEIRMTVYRDTQAISRLKATGGCVFKLEPRAGAAGRGPGGHGHRRLR